MSEEILTQENDVRANFITHIIDEDLASGKHNSVHTRFPPEPKWLFTYWSRQINLLKTSELLKITKVYVTSVLMTPTQ